MKKMMELKDTNLENENSIPKYFLANNPDINQVL